LPNVSAPPGYTANDLVFSDNFSGTSLSSSWVPYITSVSNQGEPWNSYDDIHSGMGDTYNAEYMSANQVSVNNGLSLTAVQQSIQGLSLGSTETFPVTSGSVSSYGNFEFNGGYLEITMQAPSGNGAWPGLWLLPGEGAGNVGNNFEIDIQEGGFTGAGDPEQSLAYHLHTPSGTFGGVVPSGINLTSGYNTYGIDWVPGESITWYLNGTEVGRITSAEAPIPDQPMEVLMTLGIGNSNSSSWRTSLDSSTPYSMSMNISSVRLYQRASDGYSVVGANVTPSAPVTDPEPTTPVVTEPVAVAPSINGTVADQTTTSETAVRPFAGVTLTDTNANATDTLTITLGGAGGTLSGNGLNGGTNGVYTLTGTAASITASLAALSFTPNASAAGTSSTTTFSLSAVSSAYATPVTDNVTSVVNTNPAITAPPPVSTPDTSAGNPVVAAPVPTMPVATPPVTTPSDPAPTDPAPSDPAPVAADPTPTTPVASAPDSGSSAGEPVSTPSTPTPVTTPPVISPPVTTPTPVVSAPAPEPTPVAPSLTFEDTSLSTFGGRTDLHLDLSTSDPDATSVTISGLSRYDTITDNLDNQVHRGESVTLTAAEVDSGLTLHSYYGGRGTTTSTLTATATNANTGQTSETQSVTVVHPPIWQSLGLLYHFMAAGFDDLSNGAGQTTPTSTASLDSFIHQNLTRPFR